MNNSSTPRLGRNRSYPRLYSAATWARHFLSGVLGSGLGETAMMIQTAGGPGAVHPINFGERRKPVPRRFWIAFGSSVLVHAGLGIALYSQSLVSEEPAARPAEPQGFEIEI
ncbi:MAG: hypothetical protein DCF28_05105, partial [Alphaproteobacteria bacterium]